MFFKKSNKRSNLSLYSKENHLNTFIYLVIIFYFLNSIIFCKNVFSDHILLLFNEAIQLLRGEAPYKDVNILYGIGSSLINAFSLSIFGQNVFSIFLITNIFYFFSFFFILLISHKLRFKFIHHQTI
jgi:hypothetical protein